MLRPSVALIAPRPQEEDGLPVLSISVNPENMPRLMPGWLPTHEEIAKLRRNEPPLVKI
jgi:hypothetical protein